MASCLEPLNGPAPLVPAKDTGCTAANKGTSLSDEKIGMTVIWKVQREFDNCI